MRRIVLAVFLLVPLFALAQVPGQLGYQGRLLRADGTAATGVVDVTFRIYDVADGGIALWNETQSVGLTNGYYATFLGETKAFNSGLFDGRALYLELVIEGETLAPRQRVASVAYALKANEARNVVGGVVDASSVSIGGQTVIDGTGQLVGSAATTVGSGLEQSGGTISLLSGCAIGQSLRYDGVDWTCSSATGTVSANPPLSSTGGTDPVLSLAQAGSSADGYLSSADWTRFNDKLAAVSTAAPLTGSGTASAPVSLPPATGLTGGYLASADWTRFDAKVTSVAAGAGVAVGGTLQDPTVSVVYGTAAGTAAEGNDPRLFDARDPLPGSVEYIQNQSVAPQNASFDISGTAAAHRFGAGTSTPAGRLDVVAESYGWASHVNLADSDGVSTWNLLVDGGLAGDPLRLRTPAGEIDALLVDGNGDVSFMAGNVGVGNRSPDHALVVGGAGGGRWLVVNDQPDARWGFATGGYDLSIQNDNDGTPDGTGGGNWTTRMRITETGDVGIGTTAPQARLHVAGQIRGQSVAYFQCGASYACTPRECLNLCQAQGLRMATYQEVYAWSSAGQSRCGYVWMLHDTNPDNPCLGFPMWENRPSTGCGRVNTGDIPRIEGHSHGFAWSSLSEFDCACAGIN